MSDRPTPSPEELAANVAAAQQWADDYAAGAIATWVLIDRLEVHLQTLGAL
ncbi:hypothetical protein KCMC57_64690 (plasmid) [Kitasatospora sp. CMC57]|uniref:Uncharacterized protein n=1 Tax=Kitasatospora sp. CMC57 TaxID=3231513 RepID=A0AB33K5M8_9ACTN